MGVLIAEKQMVRRIDGTHWADLNPGEFSYIMDGSAPKWFNFWAEGNETAITIPIAPQCNESGATWRINGNLDRPTIKPSVNSIIWHGWVTNGIARGV